MADKQSVLVYGPNLRAPDGATFHVHAPGCSDTRKALYRMAEQPPWTAEVGSVRDVTTNIYEPDCFLYDPADEEEAAPYEQDIKIFPCVKGLK